MHLTAQKICMLVVGKEASAHSTLHGIANYVKTATRKIVSSNRYKRLACCSVTHTVFLEAKTQLWKLMWAISGCWIASSGSPLHPPLHPPLHLVVLIRFAWFLSALSSIDSNNFFICSCTCSLLGNTWLGELFQYLCPWHSTKFSIPLSFHLRKGSTNGNGNEWQMLLAEPRGFVLPPQIFFPSILLALS